MRTRWIAKQKIRLEPADMKFKTKAAKRTARRGRPRRSNVMRTPSGQISRSTRQKEINEEEIMQTALEQRWRNHGLNKKQAKRAEAGHVLGRIFLDNKLGKHNKADSLAHVRLQAGNRYAEDVARYFGLTGIPFPSARAQNLFAVRGHEGEDNLSRAAATRAATNRIMDLEGCLLGCHWQGRQVAATIRNVCVIDIDEAREWPEHMMEWLRTGLDALVMFYGIRDES